MAKSCYNPAYVTSGMTAFKHVNAMSILSHMITRLELCFKISGPIIHPFVIYFNNLIEWSWLMNYLNQKSIM